MTIKRDAKNERVYVSDIGANLEAFRLAVLKDERSYCNNGASLLASVGDELGVVHRILDYLEDNVASGFYGPNSALSREELEDVAETFACREDWYFGKIVRAMAHGI